MDDRSDSLVGTLFAGRFQIKSLLGRGGMGAVYLAEHVVLQRTVAVKVIHKELISDLNVAARFRREARAASRIANPHVTSVFDFGHTEDGRPYLVLEYAPGETLASVLDRGERLPLARSLCILIQVADGMIAAHTSQVVHRDLQPRNIVLSARRGREDFVKILDFGLAKLVDSGGLRSSLTGHGTVVGTPEYMSPEQCLSEPTGPASDVYSFGALAFELLAGRPPFDGAVVDLMAAHVHQEAPAPSSGLSEPLPPGLDELVLRCLSKRPQDRPTSSMILEELARLYRSLSEGPIEQLTAAYLITSTKAFARATTPSDETLPARQGTEADDDESTAREPLDKSVSGEATAVTLCDLAFALRDRGLGPVALSELAAVLLSAGDRLLEDEVQLGELERERMEIELRTGQREARLRQALAQLEHERQGMRTLRPSWDHTQLGLGTLGGDDAAAPARLDRNALELSRNIQNIVSEAERQIVVIDRRTEELRASVERSRAELLRQEQLLVAMLMQTVTAEAGRVDEHLRELFAQSGLGWLWGGQPGR